MGLFYWLLAINIITIVLYALKKPHIIGMKDKKRQKLDIIDMVKISVVINIAVVFAYFGDINRVKGNNIWIALLIGNIGSLVIAFLLAIKHNKDLKKLIEANSK